MMSEETTSGSKDWKARKEEQARQRKRENDLKKCEDKISALEEKNAAIEQEMALPENCTDLGKLNTLTKEKAANDESLAALYDQWETLSTADSV